MYMYRYVEVKESLIMKYTFLTNFFLIIKQNHGRECQTQLQQNLASNN